MLAGGGSEDGSDLVDWRAASRSARGLPHAQLILTRRIDAAGSSLALCFASLPDQARLRCCSAPWSGLWLVACPAERQLSLRDAEYAAAARVRLGFPAHPDNPFCGRAQSGRAGIAARTRRHDIVRDTLRGCLEWAGFSAAIGQVEPGLPHIPDVRATSLHTPLAYFEVGVLHPHRHYARRRLLDWASSPDGFAQELWHRRLVQDYGGAAGVLPLTLRSTLCPLWPARLGVGTRRLFLGYAAQYAARLNCKRLGSLGVLPRSLLPSFSGLRVLWRWPFSAGTSRCSLLARRRCPRALVDWRGL